MNKHFEKNDLDVTYSRWNVGSGTEYVLPPLSLDKKLMILKIKDGEYTRIDFKLFEFNDLLIFHDLLSDQKYGFDIDDIGLDKIYIRVQNGKGAIWTRLPLKPSDDLLKHFH
ncbi:hypothetical protein [Cellulophaga lytica]|uniref:Uncharacterized protein n=1 Tax=Cellulophaga lytica (strain ATCC 23178 / DSM 7489 / JCM 8516 / NBRC 14961 / NCIMB 1423 / VKM B-1433 / Cy l20) TaxID=867900 RepID=F0RDK8_CELLC|nr:hypothetical protein [Cellulophaga lytica]ADY28756.1 hypothetical protein Celly_0925 [Cellulophaga lytica DSM 7489]AIM59798.1 hypothetical protein IX49_04405 [Cellulophaga lytica]WQG77064.1 hypothetical protein SR888_15390 [Cellulophaga lytica]